MEIGTRPRAGHLFMILFLQPDIISKLCTRHSIKIMECAETDASWSAGKDLIILGIYQDPELRLISFFHELGHCLDSRQIPDVRKMDYWKDYPYNHYFEAKAWKIGLQIASENGINFSSNSKEWAAKQLLSYFEDDSPERTPVKYYSRALIDAGLK